MTNTKERSVRNAAQTVVKERAYTPTEYGRFVYTASPLARIEMIEKGVSPDTVIIIGKEMGVSQEKNLSCLGIPRASFNRWRKDSQALPKEISERVIGLQSLIGQVEDMVDKSGATRGFNAARWLTEWMGQPLPALNNAKPEEFMDTVEGIKLVSSLLDQTQSGAYA
jgi:putative toxin-antitoxin system antitoxin component (TIGR02293 family)